MSRFLVSSYNIFNSFHDEANNLNQVLFATRLSFEIWHDQDFVFEILSLKFFKLKI